MLWVEHSVGIRVYISLGKGKKKRENRLNFSRSYVLYTSVVSIRRRIFTSACSYWTSWRRRRPRTKGGLFCRLCPDYQVAVSVFPNSRLEIRIRVRRVFVVLKYECTINPSSCSPLGSRCKKAIVSVDGLRRPVKKNLQLGYADTYPLHNESYRCWKWWRWCRLRAALVPLNEHEGRRGEAFFLFKLAILSADVVTLVCSWQWHRLGFYSF